MTCKLGILRDPFTYFNFSQVNHSKDQTSMLCNMDQCLWIVSNIFLLVIELLWVINLLFWLWFFYLTTELHTCNTSNKTLSTSSKKYYFKPHAYHPDQQLNAFIPNILNVVNVSTQVQLVSACTLFIYFLHDLELLVTMIVLKIME